MACMSLLSRSWQSQEVKIVPKGGGVYVGSERGLTGLGRREIYRNDWKSNVVTGKA